MIDSNMSISLCDLLCDKVRSKMSININNSIYNIWNYDEILKSWKNYEYMGCKLMTEF